MMTMAEENEIQEFLNKAGERAAAGYNAAMRDGSIPSLGREAVKDVRNTIHEFFFGRGEGHGEPGTPLNPLFHDIVQARESHEVTPESPAPALPPSPADLTDGAASQHQATKAGVSPADLVEPTGSVYGQQRQQGVSQAGPELPADVRADVKAAGADVKDSIKDSPADIGREELGQLPTQDPPRHRLKL
jgi:hypothetical protein